MAHRQNDEKIMTELEKLCLGLPREERERLTNLLLNSLEFWLTGKGFDELHEAIVKVMGHEVLNSSRSRHMIIGRTILAYACHKEGMTETEIGERMNRDHSSVHQRIVRMKEWLSMPSLFKEEVNLYNKFIEELNYETDRRRISESVWV